MEFGAKFAGTYVHFDAQMSYAGSRVVITKQTDYYIPHVHAPNVNYSTVFAIITSS